MILQTSSVFMPTVLTASNSSCRDPPNPVWPVGKFYGSRMSKRLLSAALFLLPAIVLASHARVGPHRPGGQMRAITASHQLKKTLAWQRSNGEERRSFLCRLADKKFTPLSASGQEIHFSFEACALRAIQSPKRRRIWASKIASIGCPSCAGSRSTIAAK